MSGWQGSDYALHGYTLSTDIPLHLPLTSAGTGPAMTVRRGADRCVPNGDPPGEPLARLADEEGVSYYSFARADSLSLRFSGASWPT